MIDDCPVCDQKVMATQPRIAKLLLFFISDKTEGKSIEHYHIDCWKKRYGDKDPVPPKTN